MARTGRPIKRRTVKSLARDIAALRRLRDSIALDGRLASSQTRLAIASLDGTIARLSELRLIM